MDEHRDETERAQRYWDEHAPRYDREMGFYEKILFKGAHEWACVHAKGDVLEIAAARDATSFSIHPGRG